jgi:hypothetical protein
MYLAQIDYVNLLSFAGTWGLDLFASALASAEFE